MSYYPVNFAIKNRKCLVIGGGEVAERKTLGLLAAGAAVTVCSPAVTGKLAELAITGDISYIASAYRPEFIKACFIVICAANDSSVNLAAAEEARKQGALVNVADAGAAGDFTVPASIHRGDLLITVSTNGKSPMLARRLREELAELYGPEYELYLEMIARLRAEYRARADRQADNQTCWRNALDREIIGLLKSGQLNEAEQKIKAALNCGEL